jgi:undecaprenyl-diphosphatase
VSLGFHNPCLGFGLSITAWALCMKSLAQHDEALFYWVFNFTNNRNCRWIKWLSKTGDGQLYLIIGVMLWLLEPRHGALFLYSGLLAYMLEIPVYMLLKKSFKRERPCHHISELTAHIVPSDKFSLPSGHTAAAFLMASLVAHFYPTLGVISFLWACCIGGSRVALGVHYPGDIFAGALLGLSIFAISLLIF